MSSPAQGGPTVPKESKDSKDKEKKGVGSKMLSRMRTMMRKRMSISGSSKTGSTSAAAGSSTAAASSAPAPADAAKKAEESTPKPTKVPRIQLHEERARKLGERFGLEIKPSEWHSTEGDALRIEKPIRMRVHRKCHVCSATFGTGKECPKCGHQRCKQCPRYPPKRSEAEKVASRERRAAIIKERAENAPIQADWDTSKKDVVLRRPAKQGGQDLVYKKPRQRLRRNCCQCNKLFLRGSKTCDQCGHARCTDCPRDPAKKDKYPYGYPGDEFGAKSIPHYQCQECKTKFPTDAADGTECSSCGHKKCSDCPRIKPQRVDPEPDPEILKTIEARLSKMKVG